MNFPLIANIIVFVVLLLLLAQTRHKQWSLAKKVLVGLVIGVVESLTKAYIGTITGGVITSAFSDAIVFGILIIVLLVKPSGLMGEPETEKV